MASDGADGRGVTIEEVFNSLSQWKAYGSVGTLPRVHLSPRSAKACLQEGVDPEVSHCVSETTRVPLAGVPGSSCRGDRHVVRH